MMENITDTTKSISNRTTATPTRRRFLYTAAAGGILGLAGCLSTGSGAERETPTGENEAIADISFEGEDLVLTATEDFRGTELHVVDPTETVWAKTMTEPTTGKARIRLLDVDGYDDDNHYPPGTFQFVFEPWAEEPHTERVNLVPEISITDVIQQRESESDSAGQIDIHVLNKGTAPTWISQVVYENSPNSAANGELSDSDFPLLSDLDDPTDAISYPGEVQVFTSLAFPLKFSDQSNEKCVQQRFTMSLILKTPVSSPYREEISVQNGGDSIPSGLTGDYLCSDVELDLIEEGDS